MARLESQAKAGYYPTPPGALAEIVRRLGPGHPATPGELRLLDPCCGEGTALLTIAKALHAPSRSPARTYGVELHQGRSQAAAEKLDQVLNADLFHTSISNNAFSLLYLNPPYDNEENPQTGESTRSELSFLQRCTNYLVPARGILALVIKGEILKGRTARFLAAHYRNFHCIKFPEPEYQEFRQITLFAVRKPAPWDEPATEAILNRWAENPSTHTTEHWREIPPRVAPREVIFTPMWLNPWQAANEAAQSGLWNSPSVKQALRPEAPKRTQPLTTLKRGHIALLTASGFLDNMVLEHEDGERILVKGNIEKRFTLTGETEQAKIYQERMTISVTSLNLATGEFRDIRP